MQNTRKRIPSSRAKKLPANWIPTIRYWSFPGQLCLVAAMGQHRHNYHVGLKMPGTDTIIGRDDAAKIIRGLRAKGQPSQLDRTIPGHSVANRWPQLA